ncbi:glycosyltransferase [Ruegeria sp. 2012CJ41-6]|uniref:Glycosyltransferase n=1 Tax=Ruegeria spongiae TaxID=2942209 RepID=A0ABT0Q141_9RHOB|nr:glycosyltransferase family A protein [Ruegeria spongiae]MCL6283606.1 glycosyltransferase [Ruegeria spongiae]
MPATPKVSVVTATYNFASVLKLAIETVLSQTYSDFEYLIIGDGCNDETEAVVSSFDDPRIRWENLPENLGNQSDVNRAALSKASSGMIAYLNHDDLWFPDHLEALVACQEQGQFDLVSSLSLSISPEPHYHRKIIGLPVIMQQKAKFKAVCMTSTALHTKSASEAVGGWAKWREFDGVPTLDFFERLRNLRQNYAVVPRITCLKFHSAARKDSYLHQDPSEQRNWLERMRTDPDLRHREMGAAFAMRTTKLPVPRPTSRPKPDNAPPGWQIEKLRRSRGLEPMVDLDPKDLPQFEIANSVSPEDDPVRHGSDDQIWFVPPEKLR